MSQELLDAEAGELAGADPARAARPRTSTSRGSSRSAASWVSSKRPCQTTSPLGDRDQPELEPHRGGLAGAELRCRRAPGSGRRGRRSRRRRRPPCRARRRAPPRRRRGARSGVVSTSAHGQIGRRSETRSGRRARGRSAPSPPCRPRRRQRRVAPESPSGGGAGSTGSTASSCMFTGAASGARRSGACRSRMPAARRAGASLAAVRSALARPAGAAPDASGETESTHHSTTRMPSSRSWRGSTGLGASVIRQTARCVFGKAITSRSELAPASSIASRSRPSAMPPCGGAP